MISELLQQSKPNLVAHNHGILCTYRLQVEYVEVHSIQTSLYYTHCRLATLS